jgi:uncharacterized protein (DUF305 family)
VAPALPPALVLAGGSSAAPTAQAVTSAPAPTEAQRRFEVQFMKRMVDHHFMAVLMAEQCTARARHERLSGQCAEIAEAQREGIRTMRSWLRRWYGTDHQPELGMVERAQLRELASALGARFEVMVMQMFIDHHAVAIIRAEDCVRRAYHGRLRELCRTMVEMQLEEIARFRQFLRRWYGIYA